MSKPTKPPPIFEVLFDGPGIYPEKIPLGTLTQTLSAIRRLAAGSELVDEEEDEQDSDSSLIGLLDVVRGSAVFRFVSASSGSPSHAAAQPIAALERLRLAGRVLD